MLPRTLNGAAGSIMCGFCNNPLKIEQALLRPINKLDTNDHSNKIVFFLRVCGRPGQCGSVVRLAAHTGSGLIPCPGQGSDGRQPDDISQSHRCLPLPPSPSPSSSLCPTLSLSISSSLSPSYPLTLSFPCSPSLKKENNAKISTGEY